MQKDVSAGETIRSDTFLSRISRQGRNYSSLVGWLLYTAFRGRTAKLALAIVLSLVHLGSQAAAIYAVFWYGKQMEKATPFSVPYIGLELNLKEQPEWLWAVVVFSTVCFVISATFLYLARRQILNVVERHYARKAEELVLLSLRLPDPRVRLASDLFMEFGVGGLATGCRRGSITAIGFANAITAVVGGIGATFFLFWIDAPLTFLILVSVGLAALLLYPVTLRAVQSAKDREKAQAAFKLEVRKLADERSPEQVVESVETADELARAYMMRRRVLTELVFAIEIGITFILGLVVYYMASEALAGREQWAIFIAYIAALRMALYGIAQPIRAFASVSRYYPQIVRYYLFAKDMQRIDAVQFATIKQGDTVILGKLPSGDEVAVKAGDCVALVSHSRMRDLQYALVDARLPKSTAPLATIVIEPPEVPPNDAAIALIAYARLGRDKEMVQALREGPLKDKVTLITYQHHDKAGYFGEEHLLTLVQGEMLAFVRPGTEEADEALKDFVLKAGTQRRRKRVVVDEDEDDDDEDGLI